MVIKLFEVPSARQRSNGLNLPRDSRARTVSVNYVAQVLHPARKYCT